MSHSATTRNQPQSGHHSSIVPISRTKTTAGFTRPGSWTGRCRQREEALNAGADNFKEDRGRFLSKIEHTDQIRADAASVVILRHAAGNA
jgi:hypothetical protein